MADTMEKLYFETRMQRLKELLREVLTLLPKSENGQKQSVGALFQDICRIIFGEDFYSLLWDESVLNQLLKLFSVKSPAQAVYGEKLEKISERASFVQKTNDLFFSILSNKFSPEEVCKKTSTLSEIDHTIVLKLQSSARLQEIRSSNFLSSEKISAFIDHVQQDLQVNLLPIEDMRRVIDSLKIQEIPGRVNAILVDSSTNLGIVIPLSTQIYQGKGETKCLVPSSDEFVKALDRARSAMIAQNFISTAVNVNFSPELTAANYSGDSIALAASMAIYSSATGRPIDPYTAFTGDVNLDGGRYKIMSVKGIRSKLDAALLNGFRRVFVPNANRTEIEGVDYNKIEICYVNDIADVLLNLQAASEPIPIDTLQFRKINLLQAYCQESGWYCSPPEPIKDGYQFTVTAFSSPAFKINIYNTGSHSPKQHGFEEFQKLLDELVALDLPNIPIQSVEKSFNINEVELRRQIEECLGKFKPSSIRNEPHCEYSFQYVSRDEKITVKQYKNGKLQLQGRAGQLYKSILDIIIPLYNLKYPKAKQSIEDFLKYQVKKQVANSKDISKSCQVGVPLPYIGTDESGKGDYFGPMVVAGVLISEVTKKRLEEQGIKDSKLLSDKHCRELAVKIREICKGCFAEVEISPEKYNDLYSQFKREGKNLNHLLAWGHARAMESLLEKNMCSQAVADQFGDEKYILSKLMEKGKQLELIQTPKGERYIAVAAASILARTRFLEKLDKLSKDYHIELPKGASKAVVDKAKELVQKHGRESLVKVAKIHFKTTQEVLEFR